MGDTQWNDTPYLISSGNCLYVLPLLTVLLTVTLLVIAPLAVFGQGPVINLSPTSGRPEEPVSIKGTGFVPEFTVFISIDGKEWGSTVVSKDGTFSLTLPVPHLSPGIKVVTANDGEVSDSARLNILEETVPVIPEISINPDGGLPGLEVTVKGFSFEPGTQVTVTMEDIVIATVTTARNGTFSTTASVPRLEPGVKPVIANPGQAVTEFTVMAISEQPPQFEPPDLAIMYIDYWFEKEGRALIFEAEIVNQGGTDAPETMVLITDENRSIQDATSLLPGLQSEESTVIEMGVEIPETQFGSSHTFLLEVDPEFQIEELNKENNRRTIEIDLPAPEEDTETTVSQIPWIWIAAIPVIIAVTGIAIKQGLNRRTPKLSRGIEISARSGIRNLQIKVDTPFQMRNEIRLRTVPDLGKQLIETERNPVIGERKEQK